MQTLNALLREMEFKIRELEGDLQKIKKLALPLVKENDALRAALAHFCGQENCEKEERNLPPGGAFENLKQIYERGFHVCNAHFGYFRKEECLFCVSFLERSPADKPAKELKAGAGVGTGEGAW